MPAKGTLPATIGALLTEKNVRLDVAATDKEELIKTLVRSLDNGSGDDFELIAESVLERESRLSTGVGYGVALPHAKTPSASETHVLLAITAGPMDFDSFDGEPVRIVFLMVGPPSSSSTHIRILGRVSRILNDEDVRSKLVESNTPAGIIEVLEEAEARLTSA